MEADPDEVFTDAKQPRTMNVIKSYAYERAKPHGSVVVRLRQRLKADHMQVVELKHLQEDRKAHRLVCKTVVV